MNKAMLSAILVFWLLITPLPSRAKVPLRVAVIGDSLTWGVGASSNVGGYAHLVAIDLGARLGIVGGRSLFKAKTAWGSWQWRNVDLIIVQFGLHDIGSDAGLIPDKYWQKEYGQLLDKLYAETGAKIITTTPFWAGVKGPRHDRTLMYRDFIQIEAEKRGFVQVADWWAISVGCLECLSDPTNSIPWRGMGFVGDGFHPGDYGHRLLADEILRVWRKKSYLPTVIKP